MLAILLSMCKQLMVKNTSPDMVSKSRCSDGLRKRVTNYVSVTVGKVTWETSRGPHVPCCSVLLRHSVWMHRLQRWEASPSNSRQCAFCKVIVVSGDCDDGAWKTRGDGVVEEDDCRMML